MTYPEKWWIPLTMTNEYDLDFNNFKPFEWIRPQDESIVIDLSDTTGWTILNNQQILYGRINYDITNWKRIINYLNSSNYEKIHHLNRAQLIDDSLNLARSGHIPYELALNLTTYLHRETDAAPWFASYPNFNFLNQVLSGTKIHNAFNVSSH